MASRAFLPGRLAASRAGRAPVFSLPRFQRPLSSEPPRPSRQSKVKFWPFLGIVAIGTGGYAMLVNKRKDISSKGARASPMPAGQLPAPPKPTPAFSPSDVAVVFVLGGPGAGKGTQCARLVAEHGFTHLSAGDLLRAEQERPGSQFGDLIRDHIKNGLIVPMEVTVQLIENAMTKVMQKNKAASSSATPKGRFLIDGFPRKMDQALRFEETVCPARTVLFYDCPEDVMEQRLLERGKTSGRADDNADSIRKRFRTFVETSLPVIRYYEQQGKVIRINATQTPAEVSTDTKKHLKESLSRDF